MTPLTFVLLLLAVSLFGAWRVQAVKRDRAEQAWCDETVAVFRRAAAERRWSVFLPHADVRFEDAATVFDAKAIVCTALPSDMALVVDEQALRDVWDSHARAIFGESIFDSEAERQRWMRTVFPPVFRPQSAVVITGIG